MCIRDRITSWLHTALSRTIATQKNSANAIRRRLRDEDSERQLSQLESIVADYWQEALGDDSDSPIPPVVWGEGQRTRSERDADADAIRLSRRRVLPLSGTTKKARRAESQIAAIAQVLEAMNLLDNLDDHQLEMLMASIAKIVTVDE